MNRFALVLILLVPSTLPAQEKALLRRRPISPRHGPRDATGYFAGQRKQFLLLN